MKTYPHVRDDGSIAYFEISNSFPWSLRFMRRVLESAKGTTDFKRIRVNDNRFSFSLNGRPCVVWEPWGDNSRYWIGPVVKEPPIDMRAVYDVFVRFRFPFTFDKEFRS